MLAQSWLLVPLFLWFMVFAGSSVDIRYPWQCGSYLHFCLYLCMVLHINPCLVLVYCMDMPVLFIHSFTQISDQVIIMYQALFRSLVKQKTKQRSLYLYTSSHGCLLPRMTSFLCLLLFSLRLAFFTTQTKVSFSLTSEFRQQLVFYFVPFIQYSQLLCIVTNLLILETALHLMVTLLVSTWLFMYRQ